MKLKDFIKSQGRGYSLKMAKEIKCSPTCLSLWMNGKINVPAKKCVIIEKYTEGVVTRKDLRPKDYHEIWAELE